MDRIKIAFDLDNVCVNTTECILQYINERLPVNLKMTDITSYSIEAALPEEYKWIVESGFRDKQMWKKVKLLPQCANIIYTLYCEGYDIYFATSSLPENLRKKINHLSRNMQFFPEGYIEKRTININDKYLLNVDILVDDCLDHIANTKRNYWSIVLDYPWNRDRAMIEQPRIIRVTDWNRIYLAIHTITDILKREENDDV